MVDLYKDLGGSIDSEIEDWSKYGSDLYAAHGAQPTSPAVNLINKVKESIPEHEQAGVLKFVTWLNSRAGDAVAGIAGAPGSVADLNQEGIQAAGKFFGVGPRTTLWVAKAFNQITNPVGVLQQHLPRAQEVREKIDAAVGATNTHAPESWGPAGKMIDAGTSAALVAPIAPGSALRNLVPAIGGAVSSEAAGELTKGEWYEKPARVLAGLFGGVGTGAVQNYAGNVGKGVANVAFADQRGVNEQAARILGRGLARDNLTMDQVIAQHDQHLPGTPMALAAGPNTRGAVRGAATPLGPGRTIVDEAADRFVAGSDDRIEPVISQISQLPSATVQEHLLRQQARRDAAPIYTGAAGVSNTPGQSTVLSNPDTLAYMARSGPIRRAVNAAREDPDFAELPPGDMALVDKAYKRLVSAEAVAHRAGDGAEVHSVRSQREAFLQLIAQENPDYARALAAYSGPSALADAARSGEAAAAKSVNRDQLRLMLDELPSNEARQQFLAGYAGKLRDTVDISRRTTAAERMYGTPRDRAKLEMVMQPRGEGPSQFPQVDQHLMNDIVAAANLRGGIRPGSSSLRTAHEASDTAGGDVAGIISEVSRKGVAGAIIAKAMEKVGVYSQRATEGRTEAVNAALARMGMEVDPAQIRIDARAMERARRAWQETEEARRRALQVGGATGGISGLLGQ